MNNPRFDKDKREKFNLSYQKYQSAIDDCVIRAIKLKIELTKLERLYKSEEAKKPKEEQKPFVRPVLTREENYDETIAMSCSVYNISVDELVPQKRDVEQNKKVTPVLDEYETTVFEIYGGVGFADDETMESACKQFQERFPANLLATSKPEPPDMMSIAANSPARTAPPQLHDGEQFGNYIVVEAGKLIEAKGRDKTKTYRFTAPKIWNALAVLLPAVESNGYVNMKAHKMDDFPTLFKKNKRLEGSQCSAEQFKVDCLEHRDDAHGGNSTGGKWWRLRTEPRTEPKI